MEIFDPILIKSLEMFDKENSPSYCEIWEEIQFGKFWKLRTYRPGPLGKHLEGYI